jgi:hypothetical protein
MMHNHTSEFEVQALAYWNLKKFFPHVRGEYKIPKDGDTPGARFDIAIFDSKKELRLVLEVKKNPNGTATAQGERYAALVGVPCLYVRGMNGAYNVVRQVYQFLKENNMNIE